MLGSSMFDLHWEHPRLPWEAHVYSAAHSARWPPRTSPSTGFFEGHRLCGGSSKHIFIQFTWKDLRLLRDAVFEVISLCNCILHRAVMTWVTQFFFFKKARTRAWIQCHHPDHVSQTCELPRLPLFDQWVCHALLVYSNCQVHNKTAQSACDHIFHRRKDQTEIRVIPTCWISWDHVSISQPLLTAHLRSSGKDKAEGNEVIQRGAHWKEDIIVGRKKCRILISFSPALPELAQHTNKNMIFLTVQSERDQLLPLSYVWWGDRGIQHSSWVTK